MKLTIFTPTYNRSDKLIQLFESIKIASRNINPTDTLEWLIIDDGSNDDTEKVVAIFSDELIRIRYVKKQNGGKHTAFNKAIELCSGDLLVCIDDDDRPTENAFRDMFILGEKYSNKNFGAFVGRVVDQEGNLLGKDVFNGQLVSNTIEIRDKYNFWGEPEVYFIDILKKYRFDEFPNEKFLTEAYLFDQMSLEHPFVYTNVVMMRKIYLSDGLTANSLRLRIKSCIGSEEYYYRRKHLSKGTWSIIRATINRQRFAYWNMKKKKRNLDIYEIIASPFSFLIHCIDKYKIKRMSL